MDTPKLKYFLAVVDHDGFNPFFGQKPPKRALRGFDGGTASAG